MPRNQEAPHKALSSNQGNLSLSNKPFYLLNAYYFQCLSQQLRSTPPDPMGYSTKIYAEFYSLSDGACLGDYAQIVNNTLNRLCRLYLRPCVPISPRKGYNNQRLFDYNRNLNEHLQKMAAKFFLWIHFDVAALDCLFQMFLSPGRLEMRRRLDVQLRIPSNLLSHPLPTNSQFYKFNLTTKVGNPFWGHEFFNFSKWKKMISSINL